jgi:hypothetical protein
MGNVNRKGFPVRMQSRMRHSQADSRSQRKLIACLLLDLEADSPLRRCPHQPILLSRCGLGLHAHSQDKG